MAGITMGKMLGYIVIIVLICTQLSAQNNSEAQQREFVPYTLDSGKTHNTLQVQDVVFEQVITIPLAASLRLHFDEAILSPGSFVRITSAADSAVQELDADALDEWNLTTAYFNGETVYLELVAEPEATGDQIVLESVEYYHADTPPCHSNDNGICDGDNRVPSSVLWSGRLLPGGCTASIYNTSSCAVTAGHCTSASIITYVMQFRVPDSDGDCTINHPAPVDQFPIIAKQSPVPVTYENDWSAMIAGSNHEGLTPYEVYGEFRAIADSVASTTAFVEIWAYGRSNSNPPRNQTQQYSSGAILARTEFNYLHNADIIFGSSGAALIHNGEIIGVQSSADEESPCESRVARIDIPEFIAAREAVCPDETATEQKSWGSIKAIHR